MRGVFPSNYVHIATPQESKLNPTETFPVSVSGIASLQSCLSLCQATDDTMACAPIAYPSTQPGLISLSEKEVVKVKEFHHDGFYLVEATSERKTGWVAKSAVRLAVVHRATHAFAETEEPDELPLAENDVVYQLLEPDEEWSYGLVKSQGTSYLTMHDIESPPYLSLSLSLVAPSQGASVPLCGRASSP